MASVTGEAFGHGVGLPPDRVAGDASAAAEADLMVTGMAHGLFKATLTALAFWGVIALMILFVLI